ncbi:TRAP transporter small permease [Vibrio penaeicida]|uniref:TRAP transporter small permease n=1 Tax=Vibrio penaeicida TaxID=104609 RepID=UPI002734F8B9|nr:TRAP transporter small permease [Vibrio penaeicida]MDP2571380.1 TRAP transporter small permease [Vibrio penaeicida]
MMSLLITKINQIVAWVANRLLELIVVITVMQVVLRYVFNKPTSWSEEVAMLFLVWYGMLSIAVGVKTHSHVAITYLRDKAPIPIGKSLDYFAYFCIAGFSFILLMNAQTLVNIAGAQILPASGLPKQLLYYSAVVGAILTLINAITNIVTGDVREKEEGSL